jgi:mono/diheme cytochrome c family protein
VVIVVSSLRLEETVHTVCRALTIAAVLAVVPSATAWAQDAVEKGKAVYAAQKCSMCHSIAGAGGKTSALDGVGKKLSEAEIRAWIVTPKEMEKKTKSTKKPVMPDRYSKLPAADIDALVAYMASLK